MPEEKAEKDLNKQKIESQDCLNQLPIKWDRETDVLIVGSGSAGLSAAVEAVNTGAKVMILEKGRVLGGASAGCGVYSAYSSKLNLQSKKGIKDSPELFYEDTMKSGEYQADPELVRIMVERSPDAINFMTDYGCEFKDELRPGEGTVPRRYVLTKGGGITPAIVFLCKKQWGRASSQNQTYRAVQGRLSQGESGRSQGGG